MEDPWADSAGVSDPLGTSTQQSADDDTAAVAPTASDASEPAAISGVPPSSSSSSSAVTAATRPSRATPRRLVAQPTRLEAVEDDPLGPLGSASASTSPPPGQEAGPPVPPLKESTLPLRTTMPRRR
ncbi:hypothetical protein VTH06DRAFT_6683, partial [Thermothelomyces fergusii]